MADLLATLELISYIIDSYMAPDGFVFVLAIYVLKDSSNIYIRVFLASMILCLFPRFMFRVLATWIISILSATAPPDDTSVLALMGAARPVVVLVLIVLLQAVATYLLVLHLH